MVIIMMTIVAQLRYKRFQSY